MGGNNRVSHDLHGRGFGEYDWGDWHEGVADAISACDDPGGAPHPQDERNDSDAVPAGGGASAAVDAGGSAGEDAGVGADAGGADASGSAVAGSSAGAGAGAGGGASDGDPSRPDDGARKPAPKRKARKKGERNAELGARGEEAAARFLVRRGYDVLERNWKCYAGEADIIARDEENLIFCEVKTRKDCQKGFPAEAVTAEKREKYEKIALAFLRDYEVVDIAVRFDVISIVVMPPDRALIRHHIAAFNAA